MSESTAIVRSETPAMSLAEAQSLAATISKSGIIPKALQGKPADVLVVLLTGQELGLGPMTSLRSIAVIDGKPVMDAALITALVKRHADICEYFRVEESTDVVAVYETKRRGSPKPERLSYTIQDAQRAKLTGKNNWQNHPAAMLRARCSAALARAVYPDLALNIYEKDEGEEIAGGRPPVLSDPEAQLKALGQQTAGKPAESSAEELIAAAAETLGGTVVEAEFEDAPPAEEMIVPFGVNKGMPISKVSDKGLTWLGTALKENLSKPEKARYKDEIEGQIAAIRAELKHRKKLAQQPEAQP